MTGAVAAFKRIVAKKNLIAYKNRGKISSVN